MRMSAFSLVVVTYNRAHLLNSLLEHLISFPKQELAKLYICNNASTDGTALVLEKYQKLDSRVVVINLKENIGGAGGFRKGVSQAYNDGAEWIGLLDDDVWPDSACLSVLSRYQGEYDCFIAVREDKSGTIVEQAAMNYDLKNPFRLNPNSQPISKIYSKRTECPKVISVDCGSFEGFFISRKAVAKVGLPFAEYFIFGDDFDYSLRLKASGIRIVAIPDAKFVRQLPSKNDKFGTWKAYYIWRNFFVLHFLYGENVAVRLKPYLIALVLSFIGIIDSSKRIKPFKILKDAYLMAKILKSK